MAEAKTTIKKTIGPNGSVVDDFLAFSSKYEGYSYFLPGDQLDFSGLEENPHLKLIRAEAEEIPPYDDRDEDVYGDLDTQMKLTIHADLGKYKISENKEKLLGDIKSWLVTENHERHAKIMSQTVVSTTEANHVIDVQLLLDGYLMDDVIGTITGSIFNDHVWNKHMNSLISEGVCYVHKAVPCTLRTNLQIHITEMSEKTAIDYHPNSNDIVRDLVHPALFPYIKGVSKMNKSLKIPSDSSSSDSKDFWGREYEDSKFQWLPSPFKITKDGKCLIKEYINNLDRNLFSNLYNDLGSLFEIFLPYFEEVWSYAKAMDFFQGEDDNDAEVTRKIPPLNKKPISFKNQELQVITKIVEYKLQPGQSYEGVWHAEGMSHENIVMTGIYFLDRDPNIQGGDLRFKRAFTNAERNKVFFGVPQDRVRALNEFAVEGFIPLGYFPTEEEYLLVFPNCHIHKISKMVNISNKETATRRIVVFFIVNPEKKIISTREIPPQQNVISLTAAKSYRLESMAERKYDKEKLNVRDIELCEH